MLLLTACALPGFITGGVVLQMRADFALGETALGIAFSVYWGVAAVASAPAARLAERIGPRAAMRLGGAIAGVTCAAIALLVDSATPLVALLGVGGLSIACATPAVNTLILRSIPEGRKALAFGLAQSSLPGGLLLAGLGVPALSETLGWRVVFAAAALLALVAAIGAPRGTAGHDAARAAAAAAEDPGLRPLGLMVTGVSLGTGAVGALNAFLVAAAPAAGVSGSVAALTLALGSALSILTRIVAGLHADRRPGAALATVAALMACGAAGFGLVSTQAPAPFLVGALLVLALGWGWMGLFSFSVVNRYAKAPERATGVMQTGFFMGGVLGPVAFGVLVESGSFARAWLVAGAGALAAAIVVFAGRRLTAPARVEAA